MLKKVQERPWGPFWGSGGPQRVAGECGLPRWKPGRQHPGL